MILILEDTKIRVDLFREKFPKVEIVHVESVLDFADVLKHRADEIERVILDHDLGEGGTFAGMAGYGYARIGDGRDACHALVALEVKCPVLVWSWNLARATEMTDYLEIQGYDVRQAPFGPELLEWVAEEWLGDD